MSSYEIMLNDKLKNKPLISVFVTASSVDNAKATLGYKHVLNYIDRYIKNNDVWEIKILKIGDRA